MCLHLYQQNKTNSPSIYLLDCDHIVLSSLDLEILFCPFITSVTLHWTSRRPLSSSNWEAQNWIQ